MTDVKGLEEFDRSLIEIDWKRVRERVKKVIGDVFEKHPDLKDRADDDDDDVPDLVENFDAVEVEDKKESAEEEAAKKEEETALD